MQFEKIPACYLPSKVLLVDDNQAFAQSIAAALGDHLVCDIELKPSAALALLEKNPLNFYSQTCIEAIEDMSIDQPTLQFNIRKIRDLAFDKKRFEPYTVLVADYTMPEMNGVTLCEKLKNQPLQKMILTGEVGYDIAVNAFNQGIIDQFLKKGLSDLRQAVQQAIQTQQKKYFEKLSAQLLHGLMQSQDIQLDFLQDPAVVDYFNQLIQTHHIVEFYLTDAEGGFLLLNAKGQPSWLSVKSENQIKNYLDFVSQSTPEATAVIQALARGEKIPYFYQDDDLETPPDEWQPYLHPAKKISAQYRASHIQAPSVYSLEKPVFSYHEYLKMLGYV